MAEAKTVQKGKKVNDFNLFRIPSELRLVSGEG
jgi:hypothetical protein